jgi:hypothetical protein
MSRRRPSRLSQKKKKAQSLNRGESMPKAGASRKGNRHELVIRAKSSSSADTERRVAHFQSDDVPKFLKQLARFREESRKHPITLK